MGRRITSMKRVLKPVTLATVSIDTVVSTFYRAMISDFRMSFASYGNSAAHDDTRCLMRRLRSEGRSFPLAVMPGLGRALNTALVTGTFVPPPYTRCPENSCLPKLFHTVWKYVFLDSGALKDSDSVESEIQIRVAIRALRQITLAFSKLEVPATTEAVDIAIQNFVDRTSADAYLEQVYQCVEDGWDPGLNAGFQLSQSRTRSKIVAQASRLVDHLFRAGNAWDRICPVTRGPTKVFGGNSGNMGQVRFMKD